MASPRWPGLGVALKQRGWAIYLMTPTAEPLNQLTAQLAAIQAQTAAAPILLLVDQFEETFTLCHEEATRVTFIDQLFDLSQHGVSQPDQQAGAGQAEKPTITTVITLRADFYAHCAQHPRLRQAVAAQQEYIGQMTSAELRQAIEEPAKRAGWALEAGLVELLLSDIGARDGGAPEPGALPSHSRSTAIPMRSIVLPSAPMAAILLPPGAARARCCKHSSAPPNNKMPRCWSAAVCVAHTPGLAIPICPFGKH